MKYLYRLYPLGILSLGFLIWGCASKPVEMIDKTEKAMQDAKAEHADFFAPEDWKAAEQASAQASSLLDQQKWSEANTALLKALNRYNKAKSMAKDARENFVKNVQGTQKTIEIRYKELKDKMASAKLTAAQKKTIEESCKELDDSIAKVSSHLDQGQFNDAQTLAGRTLRKVWEVQQDLTSYTGKK